MNKPITPKEFEQILKEAWDKSAEGFTQEEKDKYFNVVINSIGNPASLEQPAQEPNNLEMAGFELDGVLADIKLGGFDDVCLATIKRVRQTIADYVTQPAQDSEQAPCEQPVAFNIHKKADELLKTQREINRKYGKAPSWQGLSDDEIRILEDTHKVQGIVCEVGVKTFARAIEQALKEKNT